MTLYHGWTPPNKLDRFCQAHGYRKSDVIAALRRRLIAQHLTHNQDAPADEEEPDEQS